MYAYDNENILNIFCKNYKNDYNLITIDLLQKKGHDINKCNNENITCLHYACENGNISLVKKLLKCGANYDVLDIYDNTIMHYACAFNHTKLVKYLLSNLKNLDLEKKNDSNYTILHYACKNNNYEMVESILKYCVNIIDEKTKFDKTAIELTTNNDIINLLRFYNNYHNSNNN